LAVNWVEDQISCKLEHFKIFAHYGSLWVVMGPFGSLWSFWLIPYFSSTGTPIT